MIDKQNYKNCLLKAENIFYYQTILNVFLHKKCKKQGKKPVIKRIRIYIE